jgi:hypothetical protein
VGPGRHRAQQQNDKNYEQDQPHGFVPPMTRF